MKWLRASGRRRGLEATEQQSSSGKWPEEKSVSLQVATLWLLQACGVILEVMAGQIQKVLLFLFLNYFFLFIYLLFSHTVHPDHKLPSLHSTRFPTPCPCHKSGKANSEVPRVGEPALLPISSNIWESSFHTPPGQYRRADPVGRVTGELGQTAWKQETWPHTLCLPCGGMGEENFPTPLSLTSCSIWESWLQGYWRGKPDFAP